MFHLTREALIAKLRAGTDLGRNEINTVMGLLLDDAIDVLSPKAGDKPILPPEVVGPQEA